MRLPPDVEHSLKSQIQEAYASAIEALAQGSPDRHIDDAKHVILDVVHSTLQDRAREHNAVVPAAASMPNELLVEVFSSLPLPERIAVTHVCHAWRAASLECPRILWSVIEEKKRPHVLAALLERSGQALVSIPDLVVERHTASALAHLIGKHISRIRQLGLEFVGSMWNYWNAVFGLPAPHLGELAITVRDSNVSFLPLPLPLFAGNARVLRVLRLCDCVCDFDGVDLSSVEYLSISCDVFFVDDIFSIFAKFTRLKDLRMELGREISTRSNDLGFRPIPPTSLKQILVRSHYGFIHAATQLLTSIIARSMIPVAHFTPTSGIQSISGMNVPFFSGPIQSISLKTDQGKSALRLVDASGIVRIFVDVEFKHSLLDYFSAIVGGVSELTLIGSLPTLFHMLWQRLPIESLTIVDKLDGFLVGGGCHVIPSFSNLKDIRFSLPDRSTETLGSVAVALEPFVLELVGAYSGRGIAPLNTLEIYGLELPFNPMRIGAIAKEVKLCADLLGIPWEEFPE